MSFIIQMPMARTMVRSGEFAPCVNGRHASPAIKAFQAMRGRVVGSDSGPAVLAMAGGSSAKLAWRGSSPILHIHFSNRAGPFLLQPALDRSVKLALPAHLPGIETQRYLSVDC